MDGYFLRGVTDEYLLVFRGADEEQMLRIICKLQTTRDKELKKLAQQLELEWYERFRNNNGKPKQRDAKQNHAGVRDK